MFLLTPPKLRPVMLLSSRSWHGPGRGVVNASTEAWAAERRPFLPLFSLATNRSQLKAV